MDHLELANRVSLQKLQEENVLLKRLNTPDGFYLFWFENLGNFKGHGTNKACFDYVNDLYFKLMDRYRYSDYGSFQNYITRRNKQLKNNNG